MVNYLIRKALVVSSAREEVADVLVRDGRIAAVGGATPEGDCEIIEASGLALLPGIIDPQVHFRDPGMEWKEDLRSGSRAAASGGVTSFLDMPNTRPNTVTAELMALKKKAAAEKSLVNYNFFIGATADNLEEQNAAPNVCGIKVFMGASTGSLLVDRKEDLERIFATGRRLIAVHAEDEAMLRANRERFRDTHSVLDHPRIRSPEAALSATRTAVELARKYRRRLHILHLTTAEEVDFLRRGKIPGLISAEVCPQHFLLHAPEAYERLGTLAQMNPPIRERHHGEALWRALREGVIDCLATDHAPHTLEEKRKPYPQSPSGMPGVETLLPVMLDRVNQGLCSLRDLVLWMCERPAALYGIRGKGRIEPGWDADLALVDLGQSRMVENGKLHTKVNWSPYHGRTLKGWPLITFVNGSPVYREGEFLSEGGGRELRMEPAWEIAAPA